VMDGRFHSRRGLFLARYYFGFCQVS
jgi:hypothetical protein